MRVLIERYGRAQDRMERDVGTHADIDMLLSELEEYDDVTLSLGLSQVSDEVEVIVAITPDGYVVTRYHDGDFLQLVGTPQAHGEAQLTMGGQPTPTPNRWLVSRADVLRVLSQYVRESSFPQDLSWEQP